jgi:hypothetical protein
VADEHLPTLIPAGFSLPKATVGEGENRTGESWAGEGGEGAPADIRLRLSVDELLAAGAVARGAVLTLGEEPVCGSD